MEIKNISLAALLVTTLGLTLSYAPTSEASNCAAEMMAVESAQDAFNAELFAGGMPDATDVNIARDNLGTCLQRQYKKPTKGE